MPQLDPKFFASQFFWIIICFALFYACVHFLIVPRLRNILKTRAHVNESNKTTAHMLALQSAELKTIAHTKTVEMQRNLDEMKAKSEQKFQEYAKKVLDEFSAKTKSSYESAMLEVEKQKNVLSEKSTNEYVEALAGKVIAKLIGAKS